MEITRTDLGGGDDATSALPTTATTGDTAVAGAGATAPVASALPVQVAVGAAQADAVIAWVEGVLGWQVSDLGAQDPVPPVLLLRDVTHPQAPAGARGQDELPTLLLVPDGAPAAAAAEAATRLRPAAVVGWPSQRERLPELAAALLARPRDRPGQPTVLRVGGSAGGVGTTTIALALAGVKAWSGTRTLVAVRGLGLPWRPVPAAALGGAELWSAADPLPGFDGRLRAVRLVDGEEPPPLADPAIDAAVLDLGPHPDGEVLVCRADAAGLCALEATAAAAVVVVGTGPVARTRIARALSGRRWVEVPLSARVARASLQARVPAGLPGSWVARLSPLVVPGARNAAEASRGP